MTDSKRHGPESPLLEGRVFRPQSAAELAEVVEQAFDYRGDVTVELASGEKIEGYVCNRCPEGPRPFVQMFPRQSAEMREIPYSEIVALAFTGEDTASGKSWEAWVAKKQSQRQAEADQAEAAARARGHL
jgi:hypothetical protein